MNFDNFYEKLEYESEYMMLRDAWNAGATAMFKRFFDLDYIEQSYEPIAWKDAKGILEDENG